MIAALLEWFLWIAAFLYCLWKVFIKAEHWTVRLLAVLVGIAFSLLRYGTVDPLKLANSITERRPIAQVHILAHHDCDSATA